MAKPFFFVCLFFLLEAESQSLAPKRPRHKDPLPMRGQNSRTWGGPSECSYVLLSLLYNICHSLTTNLVVLWLLHLLLLSSMRADTISFVPWCLQSGHHCGLCAGWETELTSEGRKAGRNAAVMGTSLSLVHLLKRLLMNIFALQRLMRGTKSVRSVSVKVKQETVFPQFPNISTKSVIN